MSTIPTNRAAYQRIDNIRLGARRHSPTPSRAASGKEANQIRNIVNELSSALSANTETTLNYRLSNAYKQLFLLMKERTQ